jgi:GrpB-like predicted nucleotidyltransferase (UPF0157 family)
MARIEIVEYQARWPAEFAGIAALLRQAFGPLARAIHHIGSTSVPGLAVKDPVCDLILDAAERWATSIGWRLPKTDA